jgi:hypothetical protein
MLNAPVAAYLIGHSEDMAKLALKESPVADPVDVINEALVLYTGYGKSPFPRARTNELMALYGETEAIELKSRILMLMEELQQTFVDEKRTRKSVTERAIEQIAPFHPELDESGLKALAWSFSFGLR